ncbi:hypothetical protein BDF20DRAFT_825269 [Mycotypha africana]|uniref:uncharacterized protein n=1 Tax=Mycotypha africana TaxID=64632 RepID=UPI0023006FB1|nr:uncharacterized protein BDF20DRAFT_825269 [Mycotypha africana]KAI8971980.1 hypothetical protein BDF20DRAFT_825269 [Mycotypha africana]
MDLLETDDPDWFLVRASNGEIGLAPSNYVHDANEGFEDAQEELPATSSNVPQPPAQLPQPTPPTIAPPQLQPILSHTTGSTAATGNGSREAISDDAQSWNVYEYDPNKKKKKKSKGSLFIGNGMICYGSETDKASPVQQYPILDVTKYLYDGKNLHIEINGSGKDAVLDLQASSKSEAKAILAKIADSTRAAQMSNTHLNQHTSERQIAAPAPAITSIQSQHDEQEQQYTTDTHEGEEEPNCEPRWGISLYTFGAEGGDEISVAENEQIYVVDYVRTDGWWRVQKVDGEMGIIPSSYVQFDDEEVAEHDAGQSNDHQQSSRSLAPNNVEDIRKKRIEEERALQQQRIAEEEAREKQRRLEQEAKERRRWEEEEQRRKREEEDRKRREQEEEERRQREIQEREKRRQAQEAAKRAELARHKQLEEDYRRKDAERKASLARSQSSGSKHSSNGSSRHQDLPKPDLNKIRTWTDRSGSFKVEAQFIDYHNGKLRLHKLNGVKIDVPVEKMSPEDIRWVEEHTKSHSPSASSSTRDQKEPEMTPPMPPRPQPTGGSATSSRPQQKKVNEKWDWFDWFMMIGIPMQASLQYASAFKAEKLDDSDIDNLTHKKMKMLGMKEEDVRRVEKFVETGQLDSEEDPAKKSQLEKDEELARKLQNEWNNDNSSSKTRTSRPKPSVSAPKDVHADLLDFIGDKLSGASDTASKDKDKGLEKPKNNGAAGFADDAWTPRSDNSPLASLAALKPIPAAPAASTAASSSSAIVSPGPSSAPAVPIAPVGPSLEEQKAAEEKRKRMQEEEQIQKIQLMGLQQKAREQQKQLEELQKLTEQQLQLQKQLAMQTGTQQQRLQQQQQMLDIQAQQQMLQQQLGQQPSQLQPSLTAQPTGFMASHSITSQPTGLMSQPTGSLANQLSSPGRLRPSASNNIFSDPTLGQWQPSQPPAMQQPVHTSFPPQQQQQPEQNLAWQALQPQMTGFPSTDINSNSNAFQPQQQQRQGSLPLPPSLSPTPAAAGQQSNIFINNGAPFRAQSMQPTGRHWNIATPDNPFGSPNMAPLQAQMTGINFSTPSPQAFNQSPLQPQQTQMQQNYMQSQMTGFPTQQQPVAGNNIFTPQGSMQYGQSAFPDQRPW